MRFNSHDELKGMHAFLSASNNSWLGYDDEKVVDVFRNRMAAARGTQLHEFAAMAITLGQRMPKTELTLNMYVNDALGFHMTPEVLLFVSPNAFGTADAIYYGHNATVQNPERYILRIHDLKTGVNPTNVRQLLIYAAYFCIEYQVDPREIDIELRIYQNDERKIYIADPLEVLEIMTRTLHFDRLLNEARKEGQS